MLANGGDPPPVFDIAGEIDFFLKAYVTIELYITSFTLTFEFPKITLFKFSVDFTRPSFLGNLSNGDAESRDRAELEEPTPGRSHRHVRDDPRRPAAAARGDVSVWSDQFGRDRRRTRRSSRGVTSIVANGGAGDDIIDLSAPQRLEHRRDHPRRRRERHDHRPAGFGISKNCDYQTPGRSARSSSVTAGTTRSSTRARERPVTGGDADLLDGGARERRASRQRMPAEPHVRCGAGSTTASARCTGRRRRHDHR